MTNPNLTPLEELRKRLEDAKQFWITDKTDNTGFLVEKEFSHARHFGSCNVFNVIEKSALDEALLEIEKRDARILELESGTANALKFLRERVVGYQASNNVFRVIEEEIRKYDPTYESFDSARLRRKQVADRNNIMEEQSKLLDEARKVIEFYGDKTNWLRNVNGWRHDMIVLDLDDETLTAWEGRFSGKRARAFLAKLDGGK